MIIQRPLLPQLIQIRMLFFSDLVESGVKACPCIHVRIRCCVSTLQLQVGEEMHPQSRTQVPTKIENGCLLRIFHLLLLRFDATTSRHALIETK